MLGFGKKKFAILPAEPLDFDAISKLHDESFSRGWSKSEIIDLSLQPSVSIIVAKQVGTKSDAIAGFNLVRQAADEAEILSIAVATKFRRNGIAERLMREALLMLRADRIEQLFLEVDGNNTGAIILYENLGFKTIANRPGYYQSSENEDERNPVPALVMRLDLV